MNCGQFTVSHLHTGQLTNSPAQNFIQAFTQNVMDSYD